MAGPDEAADFKTGIARMYESHRAWEAGNPEENPTSGPRKPKCPLCGGKGYIWYTKVDQYGTEAEYVRDCDCRKAKRAAEMLERSGVRSQFSEKTFDSFEAEPGTRLELIKAGAQGYATDLAINVRRGTPQHLSIMFCGQPGSGKTHLCTAIAGELTRRLVPVTYISYREAVTELKRELVEDPEKYESRMRKYKNAVVLCVDDMLKGKVTDSDRSILFEIVNARYLSKLPMIISTEMLKGELVNWDEAIGSRLVEMCGGPSGNIKTMPEGNYRLRNR